jgi:uncharacterized membrane protein SpoIIM required for sporulation
MDEREFVSQKQASWKRLDQISRKALENGGVRALSREEIRELGPLYRRVSSDLAYARAHAVSNSLKTHLNTLVAQSYSLLYQTDTRNWNGMRRFFTHDFPQTFRRRIYFFLTAVFGMSLGVIIAYLLVLHSSNNINIFIPPGSMLHSSIKYWESGNVFHKTGDGKSALYASTLMRNNIQVSFVAYAGGILAGVPTLIMLFYNGAVLGGLVALIHNVHQFGNFWPGILPHGVVELSETCIAGAAGLSLGWALLVPGEYSRKEALKLASADSVKLVLGGVLLLIFAGLVEGFISHSMLPKSIKLIFGPLSGLALYSYLFLSGRDPKVSK